MPRAPKADLAHDIPQRPAWTGSTRRDQLPADWHTRRNACRDQANGECQCAGCPQCATGNPLRTCGRTGTDADHHTPGNNHHPDNLQWLCHECHTHKTNHERARPIRRHQQ